MSNFDFYFFLIIRSNRYYIYIVKDIDYNIPRAEINIQSNSIK